MKFVSTHDSFTDIYNHTTSSKDDTPEEKAAALISAAILVLSESIDRVAKELELQSENK